MINIYCLFHTIDCIKSLLYCCFISYRLDLVQIPEKRTRCVPILILPLVREAMDVLVTAREDNNLLMCNKFFFASDSTNGHLQQCKVLGDIAKRAKLEKPNLMRSTNLRKYMSTVTQVFTFYANLLVWNKLFSYCCRLTLSLVLFCYFV